MHIVRWKSDDAEGIEIKTNVLKNWSYNDESYEILYPLLSARRAILPTRINLASWGMKFGIQKVGPYAEFLA